MSTTVWALLVPEILSLSNKRRALQFYAAGSLLLEVRRGSVMCKRKQDYTNLRTARSLPVMFRPDYESLQAQPLKGSLNGNLPNKAPTPPAATTLAVTRRALPGRGQVVDW